MTITDYINTLDVDLYPQTRTALENIWSEPRSEVILSGPSPSSKTTIGCISMGFIIHNLVCNPPTKAFNSCVVVQGVNLRYAKIYTETILNKYSLIKFKYNSNNSIPLSKNLELILASGRTNLLGLNILACFTSENPDTKEMINLRHRIEAEESVIIYDTWEDRDKLFITQGKVCAMYNSQIYMYEGKLINAPR